MKNRNEDSNIEKELFEFFEELKENQEIPISTRNAINNAFKIEKRNNLKIKVRIPQIVVYLFSIIIISTGVVFANDIVNFVKSLFINTTNSIDKAVENGYVQQINMDYIYDNNIGIKIDNLIIDDTNIDISIRYKINDSMIELIELYEYEVRDQNNNLIYELNLNNKEVADASHLIKYNDSVKINNNEFNESLLITSNKFNDYKKIKFKINSVRIKKDDEFYIQSGNWTFEQDIDTKVLDRKNYTYIIDYNNVFESYNINITETSLKMELFFKNNINNDLIKQKDNIILIDKAGKCYEYSILKAIDNKLYLEYDIGLYNDNIEELELMLKYNKDSEEKIIMKKGIVE